MACWLPPVTLHSHLGAPEGGARGLTGPGPPYPAGLFQREEVPLHERLIDDIAMPCAPCGRERLQLGLVVPSLLWHQLPLQTPRLGESWQRLL